MSNYWPWWLGAIGLAAVTINYTITTDRSFGVSSAWDRVVHWRRERRFERMEEQVVDNHALAAALAAATVEQFGPQPVGARPHASAPSFASCGDEPPYPVDPEPTAGGSSATVSTLRQAPLISQAALLLSIFVGGWVAAVTSGRFKIRLDMGEAFSSIVTGNRLHMVGVLFLGGILVGFGTRLAGGCSSGHGLSGCGRLRPVSLVATAVFFGTAVVVSFLLWKVI
ncbi:MAG TPA: YeeE/YedE thiosulfate transporter family protein [Micromonosporaceae bacterium]